MTAGLSGDGRRPRAELVRELYESGLTQGQVALRLRISIQSVRQDMRSLDVQPRLMVVNQRHVTKPPPVMDVNPWAPAIAYSADRGWHMTNVPAVWALDMLADLD